MARIYGLDEYVERVEHGRLKLLSKLPPKKSFDELELLARCNLTKPNFVRLGKQRQKEVRAWALSRDLRRWL